MQHLSESLPQREMVSAYLLKTPFQGRVLLNCLLEFVDAGGSDATELPSAQRWLEQRAAVHHRGALGKEGKHTVLHRTSFIPRVIIPRLISHPWINNKTLGPIQFRASSPPLSPALPLRAQGCGCRRWKGWRGYSSPPSRRGPPSDAPQTRLDRDAKGRGLNRGSQSTGFAANGGERPLYYFPHHHLKGQGTHPGRPFRANPTSIQPERRPNSRLLQHFINGRTWTKRAPMLWMPQMPGVWAT